MHSTLLQLVLLLLGSSSSSSCIGVELQGTSRCEKAFFEKKSSKKKPQKLRKIKQENS
jgi:hypothetical protein